MTMLKTDAVDILRLEISGLTCAGCVRRAETALAEVPGVIAAQVNLATHGAEITYGSENGSGAGSTDQGDPIRRGTITKELAVALDRAGYPAAQDRIKLDITGATCASCARRIETALLAVPGVTEATFNLGTLQAHVQVLARAVNPRDITDAVRKAGYGAEIATKDPGQGEDASLSRQEAEIAALRRDTLVAAGFALPVVVLAMGGHVFPAFHRLLHDVVGMELVNIWQFLFTSIVMFGPGWRFFRAGVPAMRKLAPDMNALVVLGTVAAWGYSAVATFAPEVLPAAARNVYFEAAAVIITLILAGRWMEARARGQAGAAIRRLAGLQVRQARLVLDPVATDDRAGLSGAIDMDQTRMISVAELSVGDAIVLQPGERVPVDAVIVQGQSDIDEAMISGEPIPVTKRVGDPVIGGTVNGAGALCLRATATGEGTVLAQIIASVEAAQGAKLPIQSLVDRIAAVFVPVVIAIALLVFLGWWLFGPAPSLPISLVAAVSVLVVACPCAMGLAVPVSIMVGTGRASQLGVLFRKGDALQMLNSADVVAFDKTGTLTRGMPVLTGYEGASSVLADVAGIEARSEHAVALAIVAGAKARGLDIPAAQSVQAHSGQGIIGEIDGRVLRIGHRDFVQAAPSAEMAKAVQTWESEGRTVLYVQGEDPADRAAATGTGAVGDTGDHRRSGNSASLGETASTVNTDSTVNTGNTDNTRNTASAGTKILAVMAVSDEIKPESRAVLDILRARGKTIAMISGDSAAAAGAVAKSLGISEVHAGVLPTAKADVVALLGRDQDGQARRVVFVGDGINDAPALAAADVGIAMGTGTDVAIQSADVVLMDGDLRGVATAIAVSQRTMANIHQNLFWAFAYNIALIPVAAGVLALLGGPMMSPMLASAAMAASSVIVVSNALRLRRITPALPL